VPERDNKMPLRSWTKPAVRRIVSGSAEFGGANNFDGSGIQS
jgi:hypothetical protein